MYYFCIKTLGICFVIDTSFNLTLSRGGGGGAGGRIMSKLNSAAVASIRFHHSLENDAMIFRQPVL